MRPEPLSVDNLIAGLPPNDRARAVRHILRIERYCERRAKSDDEIVAAIIRVLEHPARVRLADKLRDLLLKGTP
jgi:hypothetical protein